MPPALPQSRHHAVQAPEALSALVAALVLRAPGLHPRCWMAPPQRRNGVPSLFNSNSAQAEAAWTAWHLFHVRGRQRLRTQQRQTEDAGVWPCMPPQPAAEHPAQNYAGSDNLVLSSVFLPFLLAGSATKAVIGRAPDQAAPPT